MADLPPGFDSAPDVPPGFDAPASISEFSKQESKSTAKAAERAPVLPPRFLRKVVKDHNDLTANKKFKEQKKLYIGALQYLPHAVFKAVENMPMPWEATREVEVLYHVAGALTIINETPRVPEPLYIAQWATMWTAMRQQKKERRHFQRVAFPVFKDDQPPLDYVEDLLPLVDGLDPAREELDPEGDMPVFSWFYDIKPSLPPAARWDRRTNRWAFSIEIMSNLFRLSEVILPDIIDRNYFFLFEQKAFLTNKALRRKEEFAIRGAPKFRPLRPNEANPYDEDWTEFNDLRRVIVRHRIEGDVQVAFPFLYSRDVRDVVVQPYHYAPQVYIRDDNPMRPTFHFNRQFNEIKGVAPLAPALTSSFHDALGVDDGFDFDSEMPPGFAPLLHEMRLEDVDTKDALALCWAPAAFAELGGNTKRRIDIPLVDHWYQERCPPELPKKVRLSYMHLLKERVLRQKQQRSAGGLVTRRTLLEVLERSTPFQKTRIDWLEATMQLLRQGHAALSLVLNRKALAYIHLDYNFNAEPKRTLTTRERKKSRLGQSFHIVREILMLIKYITDAHIEFRRGAIDAYRLADAVHYLFTHVAKLTGIYRYKYRVMHQVREARDLKHLIYSRFNAGGVGKGPGMGFWGPVWRVWVFFLRGMTPLMHRYLQNLVDRLIEGRKFRTTAKRITKQRVESNYNINLKRGLYADVAAIIPEGASEAEQQITQKKMSKSVETVFREWKRGKEWNPRGLPKIVEDIIRANVKRKVDWYVEQAHLCRISVQKELSIDKNMFEKNLGRLTRLKVMDEMARQRKYLADPQLTEGHATKMLECMTDWISTRNIPKIPFPQQNHPAEVLLLRLSLSRLNDQHNIGNRLTQGQKEEKRLIEEALDNPHETLAKIRDQLARKRIFKAIKISFQENYSHLIPQYTVDAREKITDAFLDAYLWYEASKRGTRLFPNWVKPSDTEPLPVLTHRICEGINNGQKMWDCAGGEKVAIMKTSLEGAFYDNVPWALFRRLLELVLDKTVVDYICARHDVDVEYKDMTYHHYCGIIRGTHLAPFLTQFWGLMIDLLLVGPLRAQQLAGPPESPNLFMRFDTNPAQETLSPIRAYFRHLNTLYIVLRFTAAEAEGLTQRYLEANPGIDQSIANFKNKKCWPRDARMRLWGGDVKLARAVLWNFQTRLPSSVASITWESSFVSVYSADNPSLLFDFAGFELRLLPVHRAERDEPDHENVWPLLNSRTQEVTARAFVQVSEDDVTSIRNRVRRSVLSVGNAAFQRIAQKWNAVLTDVLPYYREALLGTPGLQEILVRGEKKMIARIMVALNSKNPKRFPPVIFYSPVEMGGLGMFSVSKSLIPTRDLVYSSKTLTGIQGFVSASDDSEERAIPNLMGYYTPWETEMREAEEAKRKYKMVYMDCRARGQRVRPDDIEDIIDKGIPRFRILFSKDRELYAADCGFRIRREMCQFMFGRPLKYWWFHDEHDGRLCGGLDKYRKDMIQALGGVEAILEHSLFKGTGFPSWEGLNWKKGGFEDLKKSSRLTKAQAGGLTDVPNRRFALWWAPTINRQDIYAGYEAPLQLTGIMMAGKLEKIKISLISLFSEHLWERIHGSVVGDIASALNAVDVASELHIAGVDVKQNHPHKSYTLQHSCEDIVITPSDSWPVCDPPSLLMDVRDSFARRESGCFWIDVQLRWGNYDSHNVAEYARAKFNEFTRDKLSRYSSRAGVVVAIDLAYNCHSAFGYWIPKLKDWLTVVMDRIMRNNPALYALRTRMRRTLQLYSSDPTEAKLGSSNIAELFSEEMRTVIVDDTKVMTRSEHSTQEGNKKFRVENGAVSILDPRTGRLQYCVIHKSVFAGKRRKQKLGRDKAAEVIASFIHSLPPQDQPKQIICLRPTLQQALSNALTDFPNIVIRSTELSLPLSMLHSHSRLGELRTTATENRQYVMSVYDDWTQIFSSSLCFKRFVLILRGYHVNIDRTRTILEPDAHVTRQADHFWPTLPTDEWGEAERQIHDMVMEDYARKNGTSVAALTAREREDIILGRLMTAIDIQQEELEALQHKVKKTLTTVTEVNRAGELVKRRVAFAVGTGGGNAVVSEFRERSIACSTLARKCGLLRPDNAGVATVEAMTLVFPKNLVRRMLLCSDVAYSIAALMFGLVRPHERIIEVRCLLLPVQRCEMHGVRFPSTIPQHPELREFGLEYCGLLRTENGEAVVNTRDLQQHAAIASHQSPDAAHSVILGNTRETEEICTMRGFSITRAGLQWAAAHADPTAAPRQVDEAHIGHCAVRLSEGFDGFFLVPSAGWNRSFAGDVNDTEEYDVRLGAPADFFAPAHHRTPFTHFVRAEAGEDAVDNASDPFN